jgi:hypothetical protein
MYGRVDRVSSWNSDTSDTLSSWEHAGAYGHDTTWWNLMLIYFSVGYIKTLGLWKICARARILNICLSPNGGSF